ncbi:hypothetical protein Tsp_15669, partial [Trichinella spiralis]|uniref:hypothetical protein n=1 Tax=Trichinella spiralis TaxID=6334 RepID=UPI0001EFEFD7
VQSGALIRLIYRGGRILYPEDLFGIQGMDIDVVQAYGYTGDVSIIGGGVNFGKAGPDAGHIFSAIPYKEKWGGGSANNGEEVSTGENLPDDSVVKSRRYFERDDCFQLKKELPEPSSTCEEDHSVTATFHKEEPA